MPTLTQSTALILMGLRSEVAPMEVAVGFRRREQAGLEQKRPADLVFQIVLVELAMRMAMIMKGLKISIK